MDMLSNLPDPILCHVLSFLPTQTAVACSVLSKRWHNLWRSIPVVDFDLQRDVKGTQGSRFIAIVDNVYRPRKGPIKTLRLSFLSLSGTTELSSIDRVHFLRLEELDLSNIPCPLPRRITFNTLRVLKLRNSSLGYVVDSCMFPKLSVLHLSNVCFRVRDLEKFLSCFPLLEELVLQDYLTFPFLLRIFVPTLTSLVVQSASDHRMELTLDTPALEYLCFKHRNSPDSLVAGNLCNLRKADISCFVLRKDGADKSYRSRMMKLLSALSTVEFLNLSCGTMHGLARGLDYSYVEELPVFHNLVHLQLCASCDCLLIPHLLHKFPIIKYIFIDKKIDTEVAHACWKEPLHVPRCLSSTLLSFHIQGFVGLEAEVKLVEYVLKHAMVLKYMTFK